MNRKGLTNERWADSTLTALDADVLLSQQLLRVAFFKSGHASGLSDNRKKACALAVQQFFKKWCRTSRHMPGSPTPHTCLGALWTWGSVGKFLENSLRERGGTWALDSMHAPTVGVQQHASRHMPDSPTTSYMPGGSVDLGQCG